MYKIAVLTFMITLFLSNNVNSQTQAEMNQTAFKNYQIADKKLNETYKELMTFLTIEEKQLLKTAQKEWLKFRDSHCTFESFEYEGGSIKPLIKSTCLEDLTGKRTNELIVNLNHRKQ
jgi:uncharacterized protein YecT (DUF1311 family)